MRAHTGEFRDRREAGRMLAAQLPPLAGVRPIVLALPRGGVPVGFEVAHALGVPLDVLAVRKLGAPANPEFGVGAITEDGRAVLDRETAERVGMTQELLDLTIARETSELQRRVARYRGGRPPVDVRGRTVIVVDDGLATGLTALAAVLALRARGAERIIFAVPVGSPEAVAMIADEADEVICLERPRDFLSVGRWYEDFAAVADEEVVALLGAASPHELRLDVGEATLIGDLTRPDDARGLVIFAHGSGSSRLSPRNRAVAATLNDAGLATLLFDLLTDREAGHRERVFDIPLLGHRLELVTRRVLEDPACAGLPVGYFGASTGAAAALRAAAAVPDVVRAVVSRGGRPDLAGDRLPLVTAPTLLIVGGLDTAVLELNERAGSTLRCVHRIAVVPGATHLFEEPGTLEAVATLATDWFAEHLAGAPAQRLAARGA